MRKLSDLNTEVYSRSITGVCVFLCTLRYSGGKNEDYKLDSLLSHKDSHVICGSEDGRICFWDLVEVCSSILYKDTRRTFFTLNFTAAQ